jgi:thiol-disulfide isomerase/thioredoxin
LSKAKKFISSSKEKSNFYDEIKDDNKVFVLFYASWCPYSKQFLPIFEEYKNSNPKGCLSVIVDDKPDICEEYSIEYYPTVILFKKGKVHKRLDSKPGIGLNKKQLNNFAKKQ